MAAAKRSTTSARRPSLTFGMHSMICMRYLNGLLFSLGPPGRCDAERAHLPIEIAALDAEHVRGARDIALLRGQRAKDVVALEALARRVQGLLRRGLLL